MYDMILPFTGRIFYLHKKSDLIHHIPCGFC